MASDTFSKMPQPSVYLVALGLFMSLCNTCDVSLMCEFAVFRPKSAVILYNIVLAVYDWPVNFFASLNLIP